MKIFGKTFVYFLFFLTIPQFCGAQMGSAHYKINADAFGAGGEGGSSSHYKLGGTIGEIATGVGSSASYKVKAGFWEMVNSYMILSVDSATKDLGSLLPGSPVTGQSELTVTTDAWNGYSITVSKNHKMLHTDTTTTIDDHNGTNANPLLWSNPNHQGFGFTIISGTSVDPKWGSNPNYKYSAFPDASETIHTKADFKSAADVTTIGYKADAPASQKSGAYSCTITYTAVGSI